MKKHPYNLAKHTIQSICSEAISGKYDSRDKFLSMLEKNPQIAAQGYNSFGKIFFWNEASTLLYGHSEVSVFNQDLFDLILPPAMRRLARDMVASARRTGRLPEAGPCDLVRCNGDYVSVFSGHLMFKWQNMTVPEFYYIGIATCADSDN